MRRLLLFAAVLGSVASSLAGAAAVEAAPPRLAGTVMEDGFTDTLVTGGISNPISVTGMADGRAVVLDKGGRVRIIQNGALLPTPALAMTAEVCSSSERGMLGFAADPHFGANGLVYLYYTRYSAGAPGGCVNRVSRFTMVGNTIPRNTEVVLLDNIGSPAGNHNGGDVEIGNDGYLYVAVGDGGCNPRDPAPGSNADCAGGNTAGQDRSLLNGKILRIDRLTGAPAPGNPLSGAGTVACGSRGNTPSTPATLCREIYAWGLRNPWRFAFDPNTGATRFYINDVGQGTREEVNVGALGANYGWPEREGFCAQGGNTPCPGPDPGDNYTQPLTDYAHDGARADFGGEYITGGAFVPAGVWPAAFEGGYLFADGNPGQIFHRPAVLPPNPLAVYSNPFVTGVGGVSDLGFVAEATGWALYYVNPATDEVRRVAPPAPTPQGAAGVMHYVPVPPTRAYDSRSAGPNTGLVRAGSTRLVQVLADVGMVRAALVNLTYIRPSSNGFLTAWEARQARPSTSNINGQFNEVAANASVVPIDAQGNIVVFNSTTANMAVDVLGFFHSGAAVSAGRFEPVGPTRVADTREPSAPENLYEESVVGADTYIGVQLEGSFGVPAGVSAVALIVTAVSGPSSPAGYVVAYPIGGVVPTSSNVNVSGNLDRRANLVVVPVGAGGVELQLHNVADVVIDVVGSFTGASAPSDTVGLYAMIPASRSVDTRTSTPFSRLAAGGTGTVNPSAVPDNALAVTQNIVVVNTGSGGFGAAYPANLMVPPLVSNVNATQAGQVRSAMAITRLSPTGGVTFSTSMATDLVVDVTGYFVQPAG